MRDSYLLFTIVIFFACAGDDIASKVSQEHEYDKGSIYGFIDDLPGRKVLLYELYGDEQNLIDSSMAKADGSFVFSIPEERERGLYRLAMGRSTLPGHYDQHQQQLDLIWDGNTVVFNTHYGWPVDSMKIILSEENRLYYQFLKRMQVIDQQVNVLSYSLLNYPPGDNFYRRLERQHRRVQNRRMNYIDNLVKKNEGTVFSAVARFQKPPRVSSPANKEGISELKQNFFFKGQFADPVLIQTDLIPRKIIRYLSLYTGERSGQEEQQEELINAVDVIMQHAMENESVFYYVLEYLINGFESMEMPLVSEHLTGRYLLGDICFEEGRLLDQPGISPGKGFKEGDRMPGFSFVALDGRNVDLHEIQSEYTLIFFWGSWCHHCERIIDELFEMYNDYRSEGEGFFEVVAIGIEDDEEMWVYQIEKAGYNWINYSSMERWDCPIAMDYNLLGTPTMILLDSEKRFLQEPTRLRALNRYLSRRQ